MIEVGKGLDEPGNRLRTATSPKLTLLAGPTPATAHTVSISAETYARLVRLADQAPLECLALTTRTLAQAKTMGYNQIGQIRSTPAHRLLADLGEDRAEELRRALFDFGMRRSDGGEDSIFGDG